jgi:hypothetical protein
MINGAAENVMAAMSVLHAQGVHTSRVHYSREAHDDHDRNMLVALRVNVAILAQPRAGLLSDNPEVIVRIEMGAFSACENSVP